MLLSVYYSRKDPACLLLFEMLTRFQIELQTDAFFDSVSVVGCFEQKFITCPIEEIVSSISPIRNTFIHCTDVGFFDSHCRLLIFSHKLELGAQRLAPHGDVDHTRPYTFFCVRIFEGDAVSKGAIGIHAQKPAVSQVIVIIIPSISKSFAEICYGHRLRLSKHLHWN